MNYPKLNAPLISIVIPSFNQGSYIEQTITSILGQYYSNLELIVIDGGSTDCTLDIINKYAHSITYYVSEADQGQANAINKGFRIAKGDILAWLNSDDMYLPCTLSKVANLIETSTKPKLIYGGCLHFSEGKENTSGYLPPNFDLDKLTYLDYIVQPSTFWSRSLWETAGEINESYNYALDWEWFIRASKICEFTPIRDYFSIYRIHDNHKTGTGGLPRSQEIVKVVETYASEECVLAYQNIFKQIYTPKINENRSLPVRLLLKILKRYFYYKYARCWVDAAISML
ncbi:glycosyltransferase family 2 protein [Chlorogloea sp. CCALA 695]|uniref:glycosyltransferase family 2 protein n=1 Tax=Chlorogloea sp. CCALA 695 TaxID=2107693 RepID=UPI000D05D4F4|nr:glycosyltransferase family 2 protein [Chlorogloea sp. CCALA 695]PSB32751.1 glycosyltransferase [Chlorogloea sp. CCALA 695]